MTFAAEEAGQILSQDARGRVLVSRERRESLLEEYGPVLIKLDKLMIEERFGRNCLTMDTSTFQVQSRCGGTGWMHRVRTRSCGSFGG